MPTKALERGGDCPKNVNRMGRLAECQRSPSLISVVHEQAKSVAPETPQSARSHPVNPINTKQARDSKLARVLDTYAPSKLGKLPVQQSIEAPQRSRSMSFCSPLSERKPLNCTWAWMWPV